jgi:pentatricopeptide repeat protein
VLATLVACSHHSEHMLRAIEHVTATCDRPKAAMAIGRVASVVLGQLILEGSTERLALACSRYGLHQDTARPYDHGSASEERCRQLKALAAQGKLESAQDLFCLFAAGGNVSQAEVFSIMPTLATSADVYALRDRLADDKADVRHMVGPRLVVLGARQPRYNVAYKKGTTNKDGAREWSIQRLRFLDYLVRVRPAAARAMLSELLQNKVAVVAHINLVAGIAATSTDIASWVAIAHASNVHLDANTLNIMLNRLVMEGDFSRCEQVVQEMAGVGIVANEVTGRILTRQPEQLERIRTRSLGTWIRAGHIEEAIALLDSMRRFKVHTEVHVRTVAAGTSSLAELQAVIRGVARGEALPIEELVQRHLDLCIEVSREYA